MCRRVWLVALLTTALSVASTVMLVRADGWSGGAVLGALTAGLSLLVLVITYLRRDTADCGHIVADECLSMREDT